jgi:hypothetical protein
MPLKSTMMCRKFFQMQFLSIKNAVMMCAVILLAAGCNSVSRDYPGVSHDQLWQAALGAARNPKYSNWFVTENGVFVDSDANRIEIYRELKRDYAEPGEALRRQNETWTFSVLVDANDRVPKIVLNSRAAIRPPNFLTEADHFFGEIDSRLAQLPIDLSKPASAITTTQVADPNGLEAPSARDTSTQTIPDPAPAVANPSGVQPPLTGP